MSWTPYSVSEAQDRYRDAKANAREAKADWEVAEAKLTLARVELEIAMDNYPEIYKPRGERGL